MAIFSIRIEIWLSILASILLVGAASSVIYFVHLKINHSDVIFMSRKTITDFFQDTFASLVQSERSPVFHSRTRCSSGIFSKCVEALNHIFYLWVNECNIENMFITIFTLHFSHFMIRLL